MGGETQNELRNRLSKEEVLLRWGEPDYISEDGQRLGYSWTKVKGIIATCGGAGGEITRSYVLEVFFDASNRVSQVQLLKEWGSAVSPERLWKAQPEPPSGEGQPVGNAGTSKQ